MAQERKYYKFMKSDHRANLLERGEFMISSLEYFAYLESQQPGGKIGDFYEAGPVVFIKHLKTGPETPQIVYDALRRYCDIYAPQGTGIEITNREFHQLTPHSLIYSFSYGDPHSLAETFENEGYDAAVEIIDRHGLEAAILEEGMLLDGRPLTELFRSSKVDDVSYIEKRIPFDEAMNLPGGAFFKPLRFADQQEARIVLEAVGQVHDRLIIRVPRPERFFKPLDLQMRPATNTPQPESRTLLEVARELLARYNEIAAAQDLERGAVREAKRALPLEAALTAREALAAGDALTRDQAEYLRLCDVDWRIASDTKRIDAMRPEVKCLVWRARLEEGIVSRFADAPVPNHYLQILITALTGEVAPMAPPWPNPYDITPAGPRDGRRQDP